MLEGEVYAIETFASTGQGLVVENGECSHFALVPEQYAALRMQKAKALLAHIRKTFGTLPFCPRWLVRPDGGSFAVNGGCTMARCGAWWSRAWCGTICRCPIIGGAMCRSGSTR